MRIGQIITLIPDRKFGFIRTEHFRDDVFFHFSTLEGLNPQWLQIGQDVEFEIDELVRINKQKLEAILVREPSRPLSYKLEEEEQQEFRPAHHPKARRRKPSWKARGDATIPADAASPADAAALPPADPDLESDDTHSTEQPSNGD